MKIISGGQTGADQGGLDFAVPVGAFGDVHLRAVVEFKGSMDQFGPAGAAGHGADTHTAYITFVHCHFIILQKVFVLL